MATMQSGGAANTTMSAEDDFIIGFTDQEIMALTVTTGVSAGLSLLGSGMIVGTYIALPRTRSFAFQMVFMLSLCDFVSSLAFLLSLGADYTSSTIEPRCYAAAYMNQFFGNGANFWTAIMAFNVYYSLVTKKITRGFLPWYHVTAWVLSLVLTAIPGAFDAMGFSGTWCWIADENGSLFHLYFFDIPLFVCLIFVIVCYSGSIIVMRQAAGGAGNRLEKQVVIKLMLRVVLVFFKSRIWGVVNRVQHYVDPAHPILALYLMQYIFGPLQGLGNAVVYGLNKTVKDEYRRVCQSASAPRKASAVSSDDLKELDDDEFGSVPDDDGAAAAVAVDGIELSDRGTSKQQVADSSS